MRRRKKKGVDVVVSNDIPLPVIRAKGRPATYPWKTMNRGASFFIEGAESLTVKSNVASANRRYEPKHFIYSTEETGVRVWRDK